MVLDLGYLILLTLITGGLGLRILRAFGELPENPADCWALALPIGLGVVITTMLGLGEFGLFGRPGMAIVMLIAAAVALPASIRALPESVRSFRSAPKFPVWDTLLALIVVGTLLTAMTPVTDGDALCYHLQVPKLFLTAGSVGFDPDLHETIYPLATEMLYALDLAFRGPIACRLTQWLLGLVFALNVAALARPILGDKARWAATIALGVPAVSNGMGAPLNDVALAAFGNAAIFAWIRWHDRPNLSRAVLTGILGGLALGVKYPALVLNGLIGAAMVLDIVLEYQRIVAARIPALVAESSDSPRASQRAGASWVVRHIKGRHYIDPFHELSYAHEITVKKRSEAKREYLLRDVFAFGLVALLVGGAWYLRAYHYTGNPVFPFFRQVFGGSGLDEVLAPIKRPMEPTLWNLLTAIGPMTLDPSRFDSVAHQFGPVFLLVLPALIWERPPKRVLAILGMGYLFLALCLTQRQSMRFVLIAVGPMAVGTAWAAFRWSERRSVPARAIGILLALCLAFEATIAVARVRHGLGVVIGSESAETYLTRREPTFRVGRWIDAHLPPTARIIGQDHRGYYIPRDYVMELAHRRRTGLGTKGESADEIVDQLRRDGFTHLLLCPPIPVLAVEFDPTLSVRLDPWLARRKPLYQETIIDPDHVTRRYSIYSLSTMTEPWTADVILFGGPLIASHGLIFIGPLEQPAVQRDIRGRPLDGPTGGFGAALPLLSGWEPKR